VAGSVDLHLTTYADGEQRASFYGLQTCGSVWMCPCCSRRISERRRGELNQMLVWAREQGLCPILLTLTARHTNADRLSRQVEAMKAAKQRLRQRREWLDIKEYIAGSVTATEVTHGKNGWHTHFHEILLMRAEDEAEARRILSGLGDVWRKCLSGKGIGLSGGNAAWHLQGADKAGDYVAKWGAAEEMALSGSKKAKSSAGRTPMQLLASAADGDEDAAHIWKEYADVFKGRRQLVWSPGLKDQAGITEVSDSEAAINELQPGSLPEEPIFSFTLEEWKKVRCRRARILSAAEIDGGSGLLEVIYGPAKPPAGGKGGIEALPPAGGKGGIEARPPAGGKGGIERIDPRAFDPELETYFDDTALTAMILSRSLSRASMAA
jgi:hypothetical protein